MQPLTDSFVPSLRDLFSQKSAWSHPLLPGAAEALVAWGLQRALRAPVVLIADGAQSLEAKHRDLAALAPPPSGDHAARPPNLLYYPAWESLPGKDAATDPEVSGHRLAVLRALSQPEAQGAEPPVIATCIQALLQKALAPAVLGPRTTELAVGSERDPAVLAAALLEAGYRFDAEVQEKGQASVRGGLVDVWPLTESLPLRIEFFGSAVESIRAFNPADQRSAGARPSAILTPAGDWPAGAHAREQMLPVLAYLPAGTAFVWSDADTAREHAAILEEAYAEGGAGEYLLGLEDFERQIAARPEARRLYLETAGGSADPAPPWDAAALPGVVSLPRDALQPDLLEAARARLLAEVRARLERGQRVAFFFDTAGSRDHFRARLEAAGLGAAEVRLGALSAGFGSDALGLTVVAEADVYGSRRQLERRYDPSPRPRRRPPASERISAAADLEPGDLVVHADHGVGRYLGLREIQFNGQRQEVVTVEYADEARLHVPASHVHLLSRYVGLSGRSVPLDRLGGRRWSSERAAAERAIADLAASLLETQAQRDLLQGHAFGPDTPWQHEFEAAFPYEETPDQADVIEAVRRDMQAARPMDRLICGDAGYGKTEVAMRAAFKSVMEGKQVAVLVPTTVLAQQHYQTFTERMAAFPVRIEVLSRFCARSRRAGALRNLAEGGADIVIGTHALLQPGVSFRDLGLVIIDEEQRFGVEHKERLKRLRRLVDVLTMTATPIPRTLYLSLTGARDMSLLQTPPRGRVAIETLVARNTDELVRSAILRELSREGQVFYLHNRVMSIEAVRERLARVVPEARVRVGHGQMSAGELEAVMRDFVAGAFDVLLCTTIIESGMDIPRANTILIDRADRFGLADLYQLRGRVGRSRHKAYAYLLLPPQGLADADARARLAAIARHSQLGAGFSLAMRDLEIRGAGNLLGAEQSGHIRAIGFSLYCQLLRRAVARLKGEKLPPVVDVDVRLDFLDLSPAAAEGEGAACIPYAYVEDERLRVGVYRRIAEAGTPADVDAIEEDLRDRFGPPPGAVLRLLAVARLRVLAARAGLRLVEVREDKAMLRRGEDFVLQEGGRFPRLRGRSPDERLKELAQLLRRAGREP